MASNYENEVLSDGVKVVKVEIKGLIDAEKAGGVESERCTLMLVEGRSARSLGRLGRDELGPAFYGVFPIQGKFPKLSNSKTSMDNELVLNIKKILGLEQGREYYDSKSLRYGRVMLLFDQDPDGSHIKGLLINFFYQFWPSLLKINPSFLIQYITPIIKVTHPITQEAQVFYSSLLYDKWDSGLREIGDTTNWIRKYCKGLATISDKDGREYFGNPQFHLKDFVWENDQDGEAIKLAFGEDSEAKKKWISNYKPFTRDLQKRTISFSDFVNNELRQFSWVNLVRSIPSMVDGLKPCHRKILFCAFQKDVVNDLKVCKLASYVLELSVYHHGLQNIQKTIIGMALDYVGSNNVNLLIPCSQFGTRASGKKDVSDGRYICTKLSPATMVLFSKDDDVLLERLFVDGKQIEPKWYIPIIPTVLVNGAYGIGSGFRTFIPKYNPRDIVFNIKRRLRGESMMAMHPWYRGFTGDIEKTASDELGCTYKITGRCVKVNETTFRIMELPIGTWTDNFVKSLEKMKGVTNIKKGDDRFVNLVITVEETESDFLKKINLTTTFNTKEMYLFDKNNKLTRYSTPEKILEEFFDLRFEYYTKRQETIVRNLELGLVELDKKLKIVLRVGEKFAGPTDGAEESDDYVIRSLFTQKVDKLRAKIDRMQKELQEYLKATPRSLWLKDLEAFERVLKEDEVRFENHKLCGMKYQRKKKTREASSY